MTYYKFRYGSGNFGTFILDIGTSPDHVKELLNKYQNTNPYDYNRDGFIQFLLKRGIIAELVVPFREFMF